MAHVSRTHRVALNWLFDRINLDPRIQIKYIDTKNQLADILTEGNITRDEWNLFLCLFNISHFSSINNLEAMSKRTPEDAGEERVTAKSKPMMNLVSRYSVKDPNVLASTASESPLKTKSESESVHRSSLNAQQTSTERPVLGASSSNYSEWNIFRGGPVLDVHGSLQLLTSSHVRERDKALLRSIMVGGVWNGFLLGRVRSQIVPCRFCGSARW